MKKMKTNNTCMNWRKTHEKFYMFYNLFSYFILPISRESIVFVSNFRNRDLVGFTHFEVL